MRVLCFVFCVSVGVRGCARVGCAEAGEQGNVIAVLRHCGIAARTSPGKAWTATE